jgi:PAS domain S-box-containing protein
MSRNYVMPAQCAGTVSEFTIHTILNSMGDSVLLLKPDGTVIFSNNMTEEILGFSPEDFAETDIKQLFMERTDNPHLNRILMDAIWKKMATDYIEVDYQHPDGSLKKLAATISYLFSEGEMETTFAGFIAVFKDVTEIWNLRRKEQELILEKERISAEKIRSLHKLAMGVAHEIRNPMVTIGGFAARILKTDGLPDKIRQYAGNILEDARELERVVTEIQAYCELPELRPVHSRIQPVVRKSISAVQDLADEKHIHIRFINRLSESHVLTFDPELLKMALDRVIHNAIVFSPEESSVDVIVYESEDGTTIEVKDYGPGIEPQNHEFIFNPFFSTHTHASGMGLAIVERIIHEHFGKIEVDSEPGRGTSMRITIPENMDHKLQLLLATC